MTWLGIPIYFGKIQCETETSLIAFPMSGFGNSIPRSTNFDAFAKGSTSGGTIRYNGANGGSETFGLFLHHGSFGETGLMFFPLGMCQVICLLSQMVKISKQ